MYLVRHKGQCLFRQRQPTILERHTRHKPLLQGLTVGELKVIALTRGHESGHSSRGQSYDQLLVRGEHGKQSVIYRQGRCANPPFPGSGCPHAGACSQRRDEE
jgi:hypothetical protein